ncbi:radical SAM family heme chaperone HemW [Roseiconus nitratireducens]|uniref:Heme chaperone HemW n=1 Tax=Roseiconus nitratireducens TaxID=2605748 RepID=A0A5M6D827_9BACT|nr:radical SAM family heme chaperone HemW [Roseiconus nitratireducens]
MHVPFCRHRCGYCNFSVVADRDDLMQRYLAAITRELIEIPEELKSAPLHTVFIGGGTPTHLPPEPLNRLLTVVREQFDLSELREWTLEANPEDINDEKLMLMSAHGVNRVSLGVQSFSDAKLDVLQRGHRGETATEIVRQVAARIANVSIDLIFAAPGESLGGWQRDLRIATSLPVRHVSTYALTFEKGTSFWTRKSRGDLVGVEESLEVTMYDSARAILAEAGFSQYEISNFARPGDRCRHNLAYWQGDPWLAVGPGAAAFVNQTRTVNHRSTTTYLKRMERGQSPVVESEPITAEQHAREIAAFGVRLIEGVDLHSVQQQTGVDLRELCRDALRQLRVQGLIAESGAHVKLTERGIHFADTVAAAFL